MSQFDAYPMTRVDELLDQLGTARFFTTLDLTKGYWQIPLSPGSKDKTAFSNSYGLYQFVILPFGLFGAPTTFQRPMDWVLRPHAAYAVAYLDDVIIHSGSPPAARCLEQGAGGVVVSAGAGVDHLVLYISRKLPKRESQYSTIEKECLVIRWAVGAQWYYLLGRPFAFCKPTLPSSGSIA